MVNIFLFLLYNLLQIWWLKAKHTDHITGMQTRCSSWRNWTSYEAKRIWNIDIGRDIFLLEVL